MIVFTVEYVVRMAVCTSRPFKDQGFVSYFCMVCKPFHGHRLTHSHDPMLLQPSLPCFQRGTTRLNLHDALMPALLRLSQK